MIRADVIWSMFALLSRSFQRGCFHSCSVMGSQSADLRSILTCKRFSRMLGFHPLTCFPRSPKSSSDATPQSFTAVTASQEVAEFWFISCPGSLLTCSPMSHVWVVEQRCVQAPQHPPSPGVISMMWKTYSSVFLYEHSMLILVHSDQKKSLNLEPGSNETIRFVQFEEVKVLVHHESAPGHCYSRKHTNTKAFIQNTF